MCNGEKNRWGVKESTAVSTKLLYPCIRRKLIHELLGIQGMQLWRGVHRSVELSIQCPTLRPISDKDGQ